MRDLLRHNRSGALLLGMVLLAGCTDSPGTQATSQAPTTSPSAAPAAPAAPPATASSVVTVDVDPGRAAAPFDVPRQAVVPQGWTLSVWARTAKPRLAVWTPDGDLLVSGRALYDAR